MSFTTTRLFLLGLIVLVPPLATGGLPTGDAYQDPPRQVADVLAYRHCLLNGATLIAAEAWHCFFTGPLGEIWDDDLFEDHGRVESCLQNVANRTVDRVNNCTLQFSKSETPSKNDTFSEA